MNDLFVDKAWDMFEQAIATFENVRRELGFELEVESLPNSCDYTYRGYNENIRRNTPRFKVDLLRRV